MVQAISLFILILTLDTIMLVAGSGVYMIAGLAVNIPLLGGIYHFITQRLIKFHVLIKIIAWIISASGGLLAVLIFFYVIDDPVEPKFADWAIMLASSIIIINISADITDFQILSFRGIFKNTWLASEPGFANDRRVSRQLARNTFANLYFPKLLKYLFSFGLLIFSLANLNMIQSTKELTLVESLQIPFAFIDLFDDKAELLSGVVWQYLRIFMSLMLFFWLVFFISLSSSFIDDEELVDPVDEPSQKEVFPTRMKEPKIEPENFAERIPKDSFFSTTGENADSIENIEPSPKNGIDNPIEE